MTDSSGESEKLFEEIQQAAQQGLHPRRDPVATDRRPIPGYLILEEIHRGGQGVVFKAIQESTKRTVALKFILQGSFATERQRFRFEREIDLASRLNHPAIVTVFDGGIANNQPFYAMEFVDGRPLDQFHSPTAPDRSQASREAAPAKSGGVQPPWGTGSKSRTRSVVELFLKVCEAVGYAHSRGVVHRDLKPANILVDQSGDPHVLDFGLAKVIGADGAKGYSAHTMTGEFVGTLSYASPEQARANPELTDTRSDVYSLGVVFYELLTGTMPYDVSGSIVETLTNITTAEPALSALSRSGCDSDIATILLRALSKDPERRYQNASLLAGDLRHYLNGEPIEARRDSSWYVLKKTVLRNKRAAIAAVSFLVLLLTALIAISIFYMQAIRDRDLATNAKLEEQKQRQIAERETAAAESARKQEMAGREEAEFRTYVAHMAASDSSIRIFDVQDALRNLSHAPEKHRGFEWWYLLGRIDLSEMSLGGAEATGDLAFSGDYRTVDFSPDGCWIAAGNAAGTLFFWKTGSSLLAAHFDCGAAIQRLRFHPNGRQVAVGLAAGDALLLDVDFETGDLPRVGTDVMRYSTGGMQLHALEFSPDGSFLVLACGTHPEPGGVFVYDTASGNLIRTLLGHENPVWSVAVSRDGRQIASADNEIRIWDFATGEAAGRLPGHQNWVWDLAFHPDSKQLASCALEQEVKVWDLTSGELKNSLAGHTSFVYAIGYSADGKLLASASEDRTIRFWETDAYTSSATRWGHVGGIADIAFGPQGQVATSGNLCVKTWNSQPEEKQGFGAGYYQKILDLEVSPDSRRVLVSDDRGSLIEWNLGSKKTSRVGIEPSQPESALRSVAYSPTGEYAAWSGDDGLVYLHNFRAGTTAKLTGHTAAVNSVVFSASDSTLYSASDDRAVLCWDTGTHSSVTFCRTGLPVRKMLTSADGRWLATADEQGITLWETASHNRVVNIPGVVGESAENFEMAFSPAGSRIAATLPLGMTGIWSVPSGLKVAELSEHTQMVQALAWTADGKRIATASREGTIKLWDSERFQVVLTLRGFSGYCEAIAFSPDGLRLVGGMYDGSIRLWNTLPPERRAKSRTQ